MRRQIAALVVASVAVAACTSDDEGEAGLDTATDQDQDQDRDQVAEEAPPDMPPDVDLTQHSVPLDDIVFNTFDSGSVSLADSTPALRARLLDAIPPIDQPRYDDATAGDWLEPDDLVVGYTTENATYAYPIKILNFHEIVIDEIDGVPVLVSYCPLCRSAIVYDRRLDGRTLTFSNTSALHDSDLVIVDRETGSYWWQARGEAIVGTLTGTQLDVLPSEMAT